MDTTAHPHPEPSWTAVANGPPGDQARAIMALWRDDRSLELASRQRLGDLLQRFAARLEATDVHSLLNATAADCEAFIWAPSRSMDGPALATVHLRRTTLRAAYRTIRTLTGLDVDPTRRLQLPPRTRRGYRPITDDELHLLRAAALARTRSRDRALATLALAETTATSSEIPRVTWSQIDLRTGEVALAGAHPIRPRTGQLSPWGAAVVRRIAEHRHSDTDVSLTYRGTVGNDSHAGQAQTSGRLRALLNEAGLTDPDLRPSSIRLWRPAVALAAGARIEDVALLLGLTSLDTTAALLGYQWKGA